MKYVRGSTKGNVWATWHIVRSGTEPICGSHLTDPVVSEGKDKPAHATECLVCLFPSTAGDDFCKKVSARKKK